MAKKNYYAVKRGHKTGIFYSWTECEKAINGYSGAVFKGFKCKEDAIRFMRGKMPEWAQCHKTKRKGKFKYASMKSGQVYKTTYPKDRGAPLYCGDEPPWNSEQ